MVQPIPRSTAGRPRGLLPRHRGRGMDPADQPRDDDKWRIALYAGALAAGFTSVMLSTRRDSGVGKKTFSAFFATSSAV